MLKAFANEMNAVLERDPAARSRLEVALCYHGFHALLAHRLAHRLWKNGLKLLARWISAMARFLTGIEIHPAATIGQGLFIDHGMGVVIGETARIGDNVTIYHDVTLGGVSLKEEIRHPQVGNNVVIGAGAQLLGPITVGDNAKIGSNAVVVKDVPEGATMVGVPAREVTRAGTELRQEEVKKFEAYGIDHGELPDPVMRSVRGLMREIVELREEVRALRSKEALHNKDLGQTADQWDVPAGRKE